MMRSALYHRDEHYTFKGCFTHIFARKTRISTQRARRIFLSDVNLLSLKDKYLNLTVKFTLQNRFKGGYEFVVKFSLQENLLGQFWSKKFYFSLEKQINKVIFSKFSKFHKSFFMSSLDVFWDAELESALQIWSKALVRKVRRVFH